MILLWIIVYFLVCWGLAGWYFYGKKTNPEGPEVVIVILAPFAIPLLVLCILWVIVKLLFTNQPDPIEW